MAADGWTWRPHSTLRQKWGRTPLFRYVENGVRPHFLPAVREGREALGFGAARVASGLDEPCVLVERRRGDEPLAPVGRDVEVVAATPELVQHLRAEARLDAHAVRLACVRSEESGRVLARKARRFDGLGNRHAERRDAEV